MIGSFLGGQLSLKEMLMQKKNANSVIRGESLIPDSFKIQSPWVKVTKGLLVVFNYKKLSGKGQWEGAGLC